jgi:hypothetical protein
MAIADEIADGLTELETDFPATFVWNSSSYKAIVSGETRAVDANEFGLVNDDELTLIVQLAQFGVGTKPSQRNKIVFNSRNYRIESIDKAPADGFSVYHCARNR